jgi:hypothetical protein
MAALGKTFDPNDVQDDSVLPAGDYKAQIISSEISATKAGDGQRLNLTYEVTDGPFAKRQFWQGLNIVNPNAQAQAISERELKKITSALGLGAISDSDVLHFKPMIVTLAIEDGGAYRDKNIVKNNKPLGAGVTASATTTQTAATGPWNQGVAA